jgi:tetratricopeptide (TPR) repeat protein
MDLVTERESSNALRSRAKRFLFYLAAVVVGPVVMLLVVEGFLRLVARGPETDFFVPMELLPDGTTVYTTNDRFAHQYFPPAMAWIPRPVRIVVPKPDGVFRILVLGGSAAMGEPEPTFSFGRVLQAMLEQQYPGLAIEVINGALATVNSHVVYQISKEVGRVEPDVVLVYMGNNEVVGPFGAGTVFGRFSPNLSLIRLGIAARKTRVGQLIDHLVRLTMGKGQFITEGQGMAMFLEQRVHLDDPRLLRVYDHFRQNLEDLADEVGRSGARLVVSTVGSNLVDHAPFASALRVTGPDLDRWQQLYEEGKSLEADGRAAEAIEMYGRALEIDVGHAALHYRLARVLWIEGRGGEAESHAIRARDLDTLRFRADSRINDIIRAVVARPDVALVDAVGALKTASEGLPGDALFYEHVHFTFDGNWVVAKAVFDAVRPGLSMESGGPPPSVAVCADRLALTPWDRYRTQVGIAGLMRRAPFTLQDGHRARRRETNLKVLALRAVASTKSALEGAAVHYERILERHAEDLDIRENFARLLHEQGDLTGAAREWLALTDAIPTASWQLGLATVLSDQGAHNAAIHLYRNSQAKMPNLTLLNIQIGFDLVATGQLEDAVEELERGLARNPGSTIARLNLSGLRMDLGCVEDAYGVLETGLAYARASHNIQAEADLQVGEAERMISEIRLEAAVRVLARALNGYVSILDYEGMVTSWAKTAEAYRSGGEWDNAFEAYEEARAICADLALREADAGILVEMGLTAIEAADRAAADRYLSAALDRFAEIVSDHPSIEWIERTLGAIGIPNDGN